jgi:hypothetical protein
VKLYLGCTKDHLPPRDSERPGVVVSIAAGYCPVCPEVPLAPSASDRERAVESWARCSCCGSSWRLEDEGFACRPVGLIEEFE